jgi:(p)ppGpp synthase/HD superfamily hydrolase
MPSTWSQDLYIEASRFAAQAHWDKQQLVPGTNIPYLMHFSFVAMEVIAVLDLESDLDGNVAVQCALLHDTLEDTEVSYNDIKSKFGIIVADGVAALTKNESIGQDLPKPDKEKTQMTDCLERIKRQPREIWMVKMADRITNLQPSPYHWTKDKTKRYLEESIEIYDALKFGSKYLADRLKMKIDGYP